jgi:hypothetical protein
VTHRDFVVTRYGTICGNVSALPAVVIGHGLLLTSEVLSDQTRRGFAVARRSDRDYGEPHRHVVPMAERFEGNK